MLKTIYNRISHAKHSRKGFTLVEICVVLALLSILTVMTVSFTALMSGFAGRSSAAYEYAKDCAALKEALAIWITENDTADGVFGLGASGDLTASGEEHAVTFADGTLTLGTRTVSLDTVERLAFTTNGKLIKCEIHPIEGKDIQPVQLVFSLRCAAISDEWQREGS